MKRSIALLFCLLMFTMPLAGCINNDDNSSDTPNGELNDWNVHFAATVADLPTCDEDTNGRLYYVEADGQFQVCKTAGWEVIAIQGADGDDGSDGASVLITTSSSISCSSGGNTFYIGPDRNSNGFLEASEIVTKVDICNGAQGPAGLPGADGQDGAPGADGQDGAPGADGQDGAPGADGQDGAPGADGQDGAPGADGTNGNNVLIETSTEPAGNNCANGGVKIMAGTDDDSDGVLQSSEVDSTQYICDGGSSATTMLTSYSTPPTYMNCYIGGSVIAHGLDNGDGSGIAANGQLESGEVDYSTTFCTKSTTLRIDINPSGSGNPSDLTVFNNEIYFRADDGTNGNELWKYDGTNAPSMVADIHPGSGSSYVNFLTVFNNELYFRAADADWEYELWKYDGTNPPSVIDINPGEGSYPGYLTVFDNELYFSANDGTSGSELWKYDGTNAPSMVAEIRPGNYGGSPSYLTVFNDELYFRAEDGPGGAGRELWKFDGTTASMVADIKPGIASSYPTYLTVFNNELYFEADDGTNGNELWKYDGTNAPSMVADINPGSGSSTAYPTDPDLTVFNNELYFSADDGTNGKELWKYDGTNAPSMVADIEPGSGSSELSDLTVFNNELYFSADDPTNGNELWKYDGTNAPSMVANINPGSGSSSLSYLTVFNNELYFSADDGTNGQELWKYDGTNQTTITYA